jgi:integrase
VYYLGGFMADKRYLKQRRQTWYFNIKVPATLVDKYGKTHETFSLKTQDLSEAQRLRWDHVNELMAKFDVLRGIRDFTPAEIEDMALKEFHRCLAEYDELGYDGYSNPDEDSDLGTIITVFGDRIEDGKLSEYEEAMAIAAIEAANARTAAITGERFDIPTHFGRRGIDPVTLQSTRANKATSELRFSEIARSYLEEKQRETASKLTEQTKGQYEATYRLFTSWSDDPTLEDVERSTASDFLDQVATLNPHWGRSPKTKRLSFADIFANFGNHETGLSNRTINRYATALSLVWKWARDRGRYKGDNPWEGQQRSTGERRKTEKLPFTLDNLHLLLEQAPVIRPNRHNASSALPWVCLISALSGMRLNEICSLKVSDLKQQDGVHYFDVRKAKTEAGDRTVPIHSRILEAGLMEYSHHGDIWLFPGLKPGGPDAKRSWYMSKCFTTFRRKLGIVQINPVTNKDQFDFHSFRRSAIRSLEEARVPQSEAAQIVGHERAGITFGTYNPEGLGVRALSEVVEKITYQGL